MSKRSGVNVSLQAEFFQAKDFLISYRCRSILCKLSLVRRRGRAEIGSAVGLERFGEVLECLLLFGVSVVDDSG